jgi:hypothetical protein
VKGIMLQNVEQVLVRGERLDVLVDRTDDLRDQVSPAGSTAQQRQNLYSFLLCTLSKCLCSRFFNCCRVSRVGVQQLELTLHRSCKQCFA